MGATEQLVALLRDDCGAPLAALLVGHGHRDAVEAIVDEIAGLVPDATVPILRAWGRGDDAAVTRALAAWDVCGCETCATRALDGEGRCDRCSSCEASP